MKSKTKLFFWVFSILNFLFLFEIFYFYQLSKNQLQNFYYPSSSSATIQNSYLNTKVYGNIGDILSLDGEVPNSSKLGFVY